jgi:hypothetical protein
MRPAKIVARRPELRLETFAAGPRPASAHPQRVSTKKPPVSGATTARSPSKGRSTALVWGGVGFVTGAVFWHAVGFWTFVSDVVLQGNAPPAALPPPLQEASLTTGSVTSAVALPTIYMVDPASCTSLVLDRSSNSTTPRPCPEEGLALRLEPAEGREDLTVVLEPRIQAADYRHD